MTDAFSNYGNLHNWKKVYIQIMFLKKIFFIFLDKFAVFSVWFISLNSLQGLLPIGHQMPSRHPAEVHLGPKVHCTN